MHHSRISAFVLDCHVDDLATATEFWSKALGRPVASAPVDTDLESETILAITGFAKFQSIGSCASAVRAEAGDRQLP